MVFATENRGVEPLRLLARFGSVEGARNNDTSTASASIPRHRHHSGNATLTTARPRENNIAAAKEKASCETKVINASRSKQRETGSPQETKKTTPFSDDATWEAKVADAKKKLALTMANVPKSHKAWQVEKNELVPADMIATAMGDILVERIRILDPKLYNEIPMEGWEEILAAPVPVMEKILFQMEECEENETPFGWSEIKKMVHLQSLRKSFRESKDALLTAGSTCL